MMCGCDDKLLQAVYETGFALDEATLYLDTHPGDTEAMKYYQMAREKYRQAVEVYTAQVGPLFMADVPESCTFSWVDEPWPWEGGCA